MKLLEAVEALYEARPYPPVGFLSPLQPLRRDDLPLLSYRAAYASSFGTTVGAAERPRILVVGCGTFEPVAVAAANPGAEILAVDLSKRSLDKLRWQARWRGKSGQIRRLQGDLMSISRSEGRFDYVIATGVLHHLVHPQKALHHLIQRTYPRAVFRCMVYSQWGRDLLYGAKDLAVCMGADTPRKFRRLMGSLPPNHPYRIYFHLYEDAKTDGGLWDGYLHPCDRP
ncbi:MAG: class I SAM-dependent methyltransferase, partial [Proteobacteria bacterium]